ncbi:plasma membrane protein Pth11-like protein [Sclerotinia borealis F-4128]|uniref:Plasma membrane protein Pth11-like protein n=1 Tax=Sclerotinia borealis (strain F-4128) TaxID=1432307 RepID=W9CLY8_SCLBF|nr:plasma membrane protein Pth11-like protein [Sclerotinia borealis F-4128]
MASLHIHSTLLYTAGTIWPPICIGIVVARIATRNAQRTKLGFDDWLIVPALFLILGMAATILAGTAQHALGHPTPIPIPGTELTATSPQQTVTRKVIIFLPFGITSPTAALAFIKLSCIFFYQRVFKLGSNRFVNISIYVIIGLIILWGLGYFFSFLFACETHFNYFWTNLENQLKCTADLTMIQLSLSISDVIMDVILLVFPIPLVLRLQMSGASKLAVLAIFTLGALAIAASITRLAIIVEELDIEFQATADQDFVSTAGVYFMYIEACFGLTAVCLPSLSGALKLKGVQTMMEGFSIAFSNLSRSSMRSNRSRSNRSRSNESSGDKHERLNSVHSHSVPASERPSHADATDIEMNPLPRDQEIKVTKRFDLDSEPTKLVGA